MRPQRYDVFRLDESMLDAVTGTYEDETTRFEVDSVPESETEHTYEFEQEPLFGSPKTAEGNLFVIPSPEAESEVFVLIGCRVSAGQGNDAVPRVFFEEMQGLDPETHRMDLTAEEQWQLMEYDGKAMLNAAHIKHPTYGTDELWDIAEEIARESRKDHGEALDDLREEVLEERYPIDFVDITIDQVGGMFAYESPATFHPHPQDGAEKFTEERARGLVAVLADICAQ